MLSFDTERESMGCPGGPENGPTLCLKRGARELPSFDTVRDSMGCPGGPVYAPNPVSEAWRPGAAQFRDGEGPMGCPGRAPTLTPKRGAQELLTLDTERDHPWDASGGPTTPHTLCRKRGAQEILSSDTGRDPLDAPDGTRPAR